MDELSNYFLKENPLSSFEEWHEAASKVEPNADAMVVSTYDETNKRPSSRFILYKGTKDQKIIFYTNYASPKSKELGENPEIALAFYWHNLGRQVRIHGRVTKLNSTDSASYFHSRDRDSQIASFISTQSSPISDKKSLLEKLDAAKKQFEGKEIPMPEQWGGYLVEPYEYEFFLYGPNRLNDRFLYQNKNNKWEVTRLSP